MDKNIYNNGRKIKGFFGLFDVLGYSRLISSKKDNLDGLIELYKDTLMSIDELALSLELEGLKKQLLLAPIETKSFAFSDTIVLYQDMPKGPVMFQTGTINIFLTEVRYLLRLAFELGIPLRGAVSYGEYYIQEDKGAFIGYPIIEAHNEELKQNWSGATLCKSAWDKLCELDKDSMEMQGEWRGFDLKGLFSPLISNCQGLTKYAIPYYDKSDGKQYSKSGIALCWHDSILDFMEFKKITRIGKNDVNNIKQLVKEKFEANGKKLDDKTKLKIENTAQFLGTMQMRYLLGVTDFPARLQYL